MDYFLFLATVSLTIQIAIIALLIGGFWAKKKGKFRIHGFIMLTAIIAHLSIILVFMVPSFIYGLVPKIVSKPTSVIGILSPLHAVTGTAAVLLGTWVTAVWRLRRTTAYCAPKAKIMRAAFIVWFISLSIGILVYFALNWKLLFG